LSGNLSDLGKNMGRRELRRHERQLQMGHNPIDRLIIRYSGRSSAHPKSQASDIQRVIKERAVPDEPEAASSSISHLLYAKRMS
jgi:hypothetical protein